jgi:glycosyltransferase involved in cell wall biosynthesis
MQTILPWQLRRLPLDACHFTNNVAPIWGPCPTILTIHDMTLWLFPHYHYRKRLLAMRPILPLAARRAAAVITVSQSARADIIRLLGLPADNVHAIYEAPAPIFRPLSPGPALTAVRHRHQLPDRFLLYVGTIEPRKNLVRLLEAFARLTPSFPHHLLLVGQRGWKDDEVFAAVERLQMAARVRFLGFLPADDLAALYNLAEALVFPSLYEGFGLPVVEAMACGTPVIASNRGALAEVAGGAAEMVNPTDIDSIAAGLERALADPRRRAELRSLGLARAANFRWETTAAQTRAVYERVVGRQ